ncbi:MAG: LLM class flavin-dependent oxidoreductase [Chloroflexi bacterium]|nr:LLM class flavin-dependent oxidoreductase [Chloroflexota bacterium]
MLGISLSNRSGLPASALGALSRRAEEHAFSHVIMNESYNDVLAYLVVAASATQRATLCSGIANVGLRHPVLMALGAAVVDDVSGGRFVLGLGTGTQWFTPDRYDTLAIKPLQMMREYVAVVRAVLSGEPVNLPGPRFPVQDFHLAARPRRPHVPILLAVVGHRMAELAGEIADGVIVNMNGPEDIAAIRAAVARGCERAKRDPSSVTVAALVTTCVDDDAEAARRAVRASIPMYLTFDGYSRHVTALGFGDAVAEVRALVQRGDAEAAARAVPDALVERTCAYGSAERCRAKVAAFRQAGVDLPIVSARPSGAPWPATYERVIAAFGGGHAGG